MYDYYLYMWVNGRITSVELEFAVLNGYITQAQADEIKTYPQ